ncbi:MAG: NAD-dependent epimerase/dehydratase family protein [Promicromonosporaceae bacterium]|nr:NAD-dependent epimerase/dehydratase family protein [Promicromonosporaceae bacterium]
MTYSPKSVLFIGGSGIISHASVARAVERGDRVTLLNRGLSSSRPLPDGVETLVANAEDGAAVAAALGGREFDVVAQFRAFTPDHVARDIEQFRGRTGQYVFISTASAYAKPVARLPITEATPLVNPFWEYSRNKIACEDLLIAALRNEGFPATIVRPSHTYDRTLIPTTGGWTDVARMRAGKPVIVHGDGTTQWTLTHTRDFAVGFVGLLGHPQAVGDTFQITGTHAPTWNHIYRWLAAAAGVAEPELVHIASETIARVLPDDGPGLLGDKAHSVTFDCAKVKALVPEFGTTIGYDQGAIEQVAWYDANPAEQKIDEARDAAFDHLAAWARST